MIKLIGKNKNLVLIVSLLLIFAIIITAIIGYIVFSNVHAYTEKVYECNVGDCIQFKGYVFGGISPYNYSWDFNDDGIIDSYEKNPIHCYPATKPTQYNVTFFVTDSLGHKDTVKTYINIGLPLEVGDIVFINIKHDFVDYFDIPFNVHMAMYIGDNMFVESADYRVLKNLNDSMIEYLSEIKIFENGVQISSKEWMKLLYENFTFGRVKNATPKQIQRAVGFSLSRDGDPYQWAVGNYTNSCWYANPNITDIDNPYYDKYYFPNDSYINAWYCTELIWASYLQEGIELDSTPKCYNVTEGCFYCATFNDMYNDSDIEKFTLSKW